MENAPNDLNPCIVKFVIDKYYHGYMQKHWDDLYSYGLEALYKANDLYDKTKTTKNFKYYATCLIRRHIYMYIRDKITKVYQNTTYTDNNDILEYKNVVELPSESLLDLYKEIKKLSDEEKTFLYYYYYMGYTLEEISQKMNVSHRTLDRKKVKILTKLKENL